MNDGYQAIGPLSDLEVEMFLYGIKEGQVLDDRRMAAQYADQFVKDITLSHEEDGEPLDAYTLARIRQTLKDPIVMDAVVQLAHWTDDAIESLEDTLLQLIRQRLEATE